MGGRRSDSARGGEADCGGDTVARAGRGGPGRWNPGRRKPPIFCGFNQPEAGRRGLSRAFFVFPLLQPLCGSYGGKRSVRSGPASRSSGNAERLGRQAETAFRGGARWRSSVRACAAGRPGGLPRHMRRAPSPGPAPAPPEQRRDGRRSAGTIGSSSELSAHFDDARKINSWNPVRDAVRRSLPCSRSGRRRGGGCGAPIRAILILRIVLLRILGANFPGDSLETEAFHPLKIRIWLSQTS